MPISTQPHQRWHSPRPTTLPDCTAATRVYVEAAVHDRLVDALSAHGQRHHWRSARPATDIGPLISSDHRDRVHGFRAALPRRWRACGRRRPRTGRRRMVLPPDAGRRCRRIRSSFRTRCSGRCWRSLRLDDERHAIALRQRFAVRWRPRPGHRGSTAACVWRTRSAPASHGSTITCRSRARCRTAGGASGFGKDMGHDAVLGFTVGHHIMVKHAEPVERSGFRPHDARAQCRGCAGAGARNWSASGIEREDHRRPFERLHRRRRSRVREVADAPGPGPTPGNRHARPPRSGRVRAHARAPRCG